MIEPPHKVHQVATICRCFKDTTNNSLVKLSCPAICPVYIVRKPYRHDLALVNSVEALLAIRRAGGKAAAGCGSRLD